MSTSLTSRPRPLRPEKPQNHWRRVCWVTEQLAVSGDLPAARDRALLQLSTWEDEGITDVIDVRGECDDTRFIESNSSIRSHWFGVDDNGGRRDDRWFQALVQVGQRLLSDPDRRVLVHCHMGVNRGPSALYAILLAAGWDHLEALRAIRDARPIAGIIYAGDAARWHGQQQGLDKDKVATIVDEVENWLTRNALDIPYVIRSIGSQYAH